jgi:replicative DNA helicase
MSKLEQYGHNFQIKTLSVLIKDAQFLQQVADIVSPDFFDNEANKWIISKTLEYFNEFKTPPTMEVFKVEVEKMRNEIQQIAVREQLKETFKSATSPDLPFVKQTFLDFCRNQTLKAALLSSVDLLEIGNYEDIRRLIDNALKAGIEKNIGHDYMDEIEERYKEEARITIETPWGEINNLLSGGIGTGDLALLVGNPGGGKSWALVAIGGHAVKLGYTVFHYTLELSDFYIGQRYDAFFTEIPVNNIKIHKAQVKKEIGDLRGKLYIKQYPAGRANVNTILAHIDKCRGQGIEPDLIVLDYADLLYTKNGKEKRDKLDDIYTSLRGMATELKIPIWTASQSNRSAARDNIIQGDQIAESYSKIMISDFALSLSRKTDDKENGTGRFHVMKNRYGADGLTFNALMDTSIGKITFTDRVNNEEPTTPDGAGFTGNERRNLQKAAENIFNL